MAQRVRALEMFLADVAGDREILRDRVVPKWRVASCDHYMHGTGDDHVARRVADADARA
ncbi:circularly permuted type 2 ATP-grasp protein [Gordonia amicalis]|nr:circularly permuted type 2 ATP-grasp protein [Gordonia amicalis]MDV7075856.1 circularly permuted type 2 ATP-grasp protein [Gordonia amicalis]